MSYTIKFSDGISATSWISLGNCHACEKLEIVQILPAISVDKIPYSAKLCQACLVRLANEMEIVNQNAAKIIKQTK